MTVYHDGPPGEPPEELPLLARVMIYDLEQEEAAALARQGRCDACGHRAPELWARDDRARCGPCALEHLVGEGLIRLVQEGGR